DEGTYWKLTFEEMGEMAGVMIEQLNEASREAQSQQGASDGDVDVKVDVETRPGRTDVVRGVSARQNHIIVRVDIEGQDDDTGETFKGTLYSVSEVWTSDELAGSETVGDFSLRMGQEAAQVAGQMGGSGLQFGMLGDPRIAEAMDEASEQVAEFGKMPVETTMWVVMVPQGKELN